MNEQIKNLLGFLAKSPTPFHAVENIAIRLESAGFERLEEAKAWNTVQSGNYYVTRNDSSLIAMRLEQVGGDTGFRIVGAHTDSPCLKVKPQATQCRDGYVMLAVEVYGGALLNPWFDRDLGLAGRINIKTLSGSIQSRLLRINHPVAFIPSLAIHLDRNANEDRSINRQKHLPAVLMRTNEDQHDFADILKNWLVRDDPELEIDHILSFELSLFDCQPPALIGLHGEFIASARLDNLLSCHAATEALIASKNDANKLIVLNDHEEVGSASMSGAAGPFLESVLSRLCKDNEILTRSLQHSMLVSADNAHAVHPNYADRHEPDHRPLINTGPVIKINHNQNYATNSESEALLRVVCEANDINVQSFVTRSDLGCGSTIGPITATRIGVRTVDIGVPQLGMHSIRELAGVQDQIDLVHVLRGFFDHANWPF
ncbi:MAG: M18 family aminopeptidase [Gammaproteobacteria bacterium]|nr:M18 family aminopeptidase [Gammaproteobacteria bacterium]